MHTKYTYILNNRILGIEFETLLSKQHGPQWKSQKITLFQVDLEQKTLVHEEIKRTWEDVSSMDRGQFDVIEVFTTSKLAWQVRKSAVWEILTKNKRSKINQKIKVNNNRKFAESCAWHVDPLSYFGILC